MGKSIYSPANQALLKWLKSEREKQGLTIRELGKRLQVNHSIIWNIENKQRRLDLIEYVTYCRELNIDSSIGLKIVEENTG